MTKPTIFISYNWGSGGDIADKLENQLMPYANVKRDKKVKPWGDLDEFMRSIRQQDFAVLVISDEYLKSVACQYEVAQLMKDERWKERTMFVVTDDAHSVYDTVKQLDYIGYWEEQEKELSEKVKGHSPVTVVKQANELIKIKDIVGNIGSFMSDVQNTNNPNVDEAIKAVIERVKEAEPNYPESGELRVSDEFHDKIVKKTIEHNCRDDNYDSPVAFFADRLGKAFPGVRGLRVFTDPKIAINRLLILLSKPLQIKVCSDPIWWFRGSSCLSVKSFQGLSDTKCLMNCDELEIERIATYHSQDYWKDFVYIEAKPEQPVGVYKYEDNVDFDAKRTNLGLEYCNEEYAVFRDEAGVERPITRQEYDDGAAVIDGKVIDLDDKAELRTRYLTKYNFVICGKCHPFNSGKGDKLTKKYLDGILSGEMSLEDFIRATETLHKNEY